MLPCKLPVHMAAEPLLLEPGGSAWQYRNGAAPAAGCCHCTLGIVGCSESCRNQGWMDTHHHTYRPGLRDTRIHSLKPDMPLAAVGLQAQLQPDSGPGVSCKSTRTSSCLSGPCAPLLSLSTRLCHLSFSSGLRPWEQQRCTNSMFASQLSSARVATPYCCWCPAACRAFC